jgi:hypothetical protein
VRASSGGGVKGTVAGGLGKRIIVATVRGDDGIDGIDGIDPVRLPRWLGTSSRSEYGVLSPGDSGVAGSGRVGGGPDRGGYSVDPAAAAAAAPAGRLSPLTDFVCTSAGSDVELMPECRERRSRLFFLRSAAVDAEPAPPFADVCERLVGLTGLAG